MWTSAQMEVREKGDGEIRWKDGQSERRFHGGIETGYGGGRGGNIAATILSPGPEGPKMLERGCYDRFAIARSQLLSTPETPSIPLPPPPHPPPRSNPILFFPLLDLALASPSSPGLPISSNPSPIQARHSPPSPSAPYPERSGMI